MKSICLLFSLPCASVLCPLAQLSSFPAFQLCQTDLRPSPLIRASPTYPQYGVPTAPIRVRAPQRCIHTHCVSRLPTAARQCQRRCRTFASLSASSATFCCTTPIISFILHSPFSSLPASSKYQSTSSHPRFSRLSISINQSSRAATLVLVSRKTHVAA